MDEQQIRRQLAFDAARLLRMRRAGTYHTARRQAVRRFTRRHLPADCLPTDLEIRLQLQQMVSDQHLFPEAAPALTAPDDDDLPDGRFDRYYALLAPLDRVLQPADTHPEGDVLYHSLQVFELMCDRMPWDEELLTAALLHDVGKGIDPRAARAAGLSAVAGLVTRRTAWLIEFLPQAHQLREGTLGHRARKRLSAHDSWDDLRCLAACDSEGRVPGRPVRDLSEAIDYLREQHERTSDGH